MIQSQMNLRTKPYIRRTVVPLSRWVVFNLTATVCAWGCGCRWVWGGMGVGVGRYGYGCGEVRVGVGMENPTQCTKLYILRARLYHFIFVCPISYFLS